MNSAYGGARILVSGSGYRTRIKHHQSGFPIGIGSAHAKRRKLAL
jgi:hypothetical protein